MEKSAYQRRREGGLGIWFFLLAVVGIAVAVPLFELQQNAGLGSTACK